MVPPLPEGDDAAVRACRRAHRLGNVEVDPTHGVDEPGEALEVHHHDVVDGDPDVILDGLDGERRAAPEHRLVELHGAPPGDVDLGVSWDRELVHGVAAGGEAQQHDRVGTRGLAGLAVRAEDEHRRRVPEDAPVVGCQGSARLGVDALVALGDGAVETLEARIPDDGKDDGDDDEERDDGKGDVPPAETAAPCRPGGRAARLACLVAAVGTLLRVCAPVARHAPVEASAAGPCAGLAAVCVWAPFAPRP